MNYSNLKNAPMHILPELQKHLLELTQRERLNRKTLTE